MQRSGWTMETSTFAAIADLCDRLADQTATLFLGAGINHGLTNAQGETFPLGTDLAKRLGAELLDLSNCELSLPEVAEIAKHRIGERAFNAHLHNILNAFPSSPTHISLLSLPWDCVYTTNYDTLLEKAHAVSPTRYHRRIYPIFSNTTDLAALSEEALPLYKLHGCIDYANTDEGRLIISQSDYRFYESNRRRLFQRLERDLQSRCLLFVGYALRDSNFLACLSDACETLEIKSLPRSFAVRPGFTPTEEEYWLDRFNIQLINSTATEFIDNLAATWREQQRAVLTPQQRLARQLQPVDSATSLPLLGSAFHQLKLRQITGQSDPARFFRGGEPLWPDIRDAVPAKRNVYWSLMEAVFPEISDPSCPVSLHLVTGSAGTGKTTLLRTICYDLLKDYDEELPVLLHIPGVPINANDLIALFPSTDPKRIVVVFSEAAADYDLILSFRSECARLRLPVTILLEERKNQWITVRSQRTQRLTPTEFELGELGDEEIEHILDALSRHPTCLGSLQHKPRSLQTEHFRKLAKKDLLVALRELTTDSDFDTIIKDEFQQIPTAEGRQAYLYAAAFGQIDLAIRYETLQHLLRINFSEFTSSVFNPTEGILLTTEVTGFSRHNFGYRIRVRHPVIASIIFAEGCQDDQSKFEVVNRVLARLDPGYLEDRRVLQTVVRRKELVNTFADPEMRRALYARLALILPDDPYVLQHRSILERDLGNGQAAVRFARQALRREPSNPAFKSTLGFALEYSGRSIVGAVRDGLYREAKSLFEEAIQRNRRDPYPYVGIANLMKQQIVEELDVARATVLKAGLLSFLEEAYERTDESTIIASQLAAMRSSLGDKEEAVRAIKKGLTVNPTDNRLRSIWIEIEIERGNLAEAKAIAMAGIQHDPTSWRLHRHLARIDRRQKEPVNAVCASYNAAIRHHKGDCGLLVEYGSFLFMSALYMQAAEIFAEALRSTSTVGEAKQIRASWRDGNNDKRFVGKVNSTAGAVGYVLAVPENFEAFFWRTRDDILTLQPGDGVVFTVAFNAHGPIAHIIRRE